MWPSYFVGWGLVNPVHFGQGLQSGSVVVEQKGRLENQAALGQSKLLVGKLVINSRGGSGSSGRFSDGLVTFCSASAREGAARGGGGGGGGVHVALETVDEEVCSRLEEEEEEEKSEEKNRAAPGDFEVFELSFLRFLSARLPTEGEAILCKACTTQTLRYANTKIIAHEPTQSLDVGAMEQKN